jgi:putative hydrolase of the HAD superfamily
VTIERVKIFFDVDGVLIDGWHSKPERRKEWDATIAQDLGIDREAFRRRLFAPTSDGERALILACAEGTRDLKDVLAEILPEIRYCGSVNSFVRYWFEKDSNLNRELVAVVERLTRHPHVDLYLATAQEHHRAAHLWNTLGLRDHFRDIFYSAKLGHLKDTPEFFAAINRALAIAPGDRPLFFDDREEIVLLARDAGWDACVFDTVEDVVNHPRLKDFL